MEPLNVLAMAESTSSASTPWWVTVFVGAIGAVATLLVALGGAIAKDRARRREIHASAARTLIGWNELPYQIRRRLSDNENEIGRLRDLAHSLQQDISYYDTLLTSEGRALGKAYSEATKAVKLRTKDSIAEAWQTPPAAGPGGMVLDGWGPGMTNDDLRPFLQELPYRFGWRRLIPRWARRGS